MSLCLCVSVSVSVCEMYFVYIDCFHAFAAFFVAYVRLAVSCSDLCFLSLLAAAASLARQAQARRASLKGAGATLQGVWPSRGRGTAQYVVAAKLPSG